MATILHKNDKMSPIPPFIPGLRVGIAVADWNSDITYSMLDAAIFTFKQLGYSEKDNITVVHVPGSIELTFAASQLAKSGKVDVIIVFGCVIRGGTPHFDYVCQSVTQGITMLNATTDIPVIFGVLTTDNKQQAIDRISGNIGSKGAEAAEAAIKMRALALKLK